MTLWSDGALGLLASGEPGLAWYDGGPHGRSVLAVWPDDEVRATDGLQALDAARDGIWMGAVEYDLGADLLLQRRAQLQRPRLVLRRFGCAVSWTADGATIVGEGAQRMVAAIEAAAPRGRELAARCPWGPLQAKLDPDEYRARVRRALALIAAGETYQVNLSQPFFGAWTDTTAPLERRVATGYAALRGRYPAAMGGVLSLGERFVVSNSPETLFAVDWEQRRVVSSPIKGTRPRGATRSRDEALATELLASPKDAAEHVMIVDLVRNDLGRICEPGSVRGPSQPQLVTLPSVHHLVSDVEGRLRPDVGLRDLMIALFPGGSITGAPKKRTVEIIDELEGSPRGVYCGSMLCCLPGEAHASIAIRTAEVDASGIHLRAGGGIVADSDPEAERLETIAKIRAFDLGI